MYKIAIISPDPFLRELLCNSFALTEAEISTFERWSDSLLVPLSRCNLVVSLIGYPFLNGYDAALRLRGGDEATENERPRIYVLSWLHDEQNVVSMLESGVDQYFTLPVNIPRLCGKIAAQIGVWRNG